MDGQLDNSTSPSANGQGDHEEGETKFCRDFMRNVCNRGNNCRFIHPCDIKIKTDPIFCHDFQQSKCFRSTCKFIHCSREEEEHYKSTGELPEGYIPEDVTYRAPAPGRGGAAAWGKAPRGGGMSMGRGGAGRGGGARANWPNPDDTEVPMCKDYLKGVCDRPPGGCKFRHVEDPRAGYRGGGAGGRGGGALPMARRRLAAPAYGYEEAPEAKRSYDGYGGIVRQPVAGEYEDYYSDYANPPPPPPPQPYPMAAAGRTEGYGTAMKALEDENFMLKRRIEELKKQVSDLVATNEYLLSQNATLRLSTMNSGEKQGVVPGTVNVTAASLASLVSMAQPMVNLNPVAVSQSLSTMSTLPSAVSMSIAPVSMSQPLEAVVSLAQHQSTVYPMVTTQGVLPPGNFKTEQAQGYPDGLG